MKSYFILGIPFIKLTYSLQYYASILNLFDDKFILL